MEGTLQGRGKVLIAAPVHPVLTDALMLHGYEPVIKEQINQGLANELITDCVGVITSTRIQLDRELLDAAPQLRWVGRMGSGMEVIDLEYAGERGIQCMSSPEGNCNAVGEHALGMLLSLVRKIRWSNNEIVDGLWRRDENRGIELEGKTVGIIGYGHTGAAFAKKLAGFEVRLLAYDKYAPGKIPTGIVNCSSLDLIYEEADIVSFHVPLQPDTNKYFDTNFIGKMRKPFVMINTSRGTVVDTMALGKGLATGKILGACLDVFEQEPINTIDSQSDIKKTLDAMALLPNVVLTPHIAGYTFEALYKMSKVLAEKIKYIHE